MKDIIIKAILVAFSVGLAVTFLFGGGGFSTDANNMKTITKTKLTDAQTEMSK
jgi:hypothetical protein